MLRITCPKCRTQLNVRDNLAGKSAACPKCRTTLVVPLLSPPEAVAAAGGGGGGGVLLGVVLTLLVVGTLGGLGAFIWFKNQNPASEPPKPLAVVPASTSTPTAAATERPTPPSEEKKAEKPVAPRDEKKPDTGSEPKTGTGSKPTGPSPEEAGRGANTPGGDKAPSGSGKRSVGVTAPDPARRSPAPGGGRRFALLVGVQQYQSEDLADLSYTEADVEELAQVLREGGYPAEHVILLSKTQGDKDPRFLPTAGHIRKELDQLLTHCDPDDLVLVAFAGHGFQAKGSRQFSFCPYQAKLDDATTLVSLNEVYQKLEACPAAFKLLLADACRNDPGTRAARPAAADALASATRPQELRPPGGVIAFYSCSAGQYAYEPTDLKHGVFFHYLIEGLKGKADFDGDGQIIREELEHYVKKQVRGYVVENLRKEQWPYLSGESNDQRPLVSLPGRAAPPVFKSDRPAKHLSSPVLLSEDFQGVARGALPRGWDSETMNVAKDSGGRACLEVRTKAGVQYVRLPQLPLEGDFFVEIEFLLHAHHHLQVQLEGLGAGVSAEIAFQGIVALQDMKARQAETYKQDQINRLLLVRENGIYRVSVNNSVTPLAGPLPYQGPFEHVRLGLTAGDYNAPSVAKIYSVKIGLLAPEGGRRAPAGAIAPAGTVLLAEDFRAVPQGGLPKDWDGEVFSVLKDSGGRTCLEVRVKEGLHYVRLPRLPIHGDFFVECEFVLHAHHHLHVQLEGLGGSLPVEVTFQGAVTLQQMPSRLAEGFKQGEVNRFRLVREGPLYRVSLNDIVAAAGPLPYRGDFQNVRLGLTAGDYNAATTAKIYAVRMGRLGAAKAELVNPGLPGAGKARTDLREEFLKTAIGALPEGWVSLTNNLSVQKSGTRWALQLTGPATLADNVTLPAVSLPADFFVECEFEMPDPNTYLTVHLEGKPNRALNLRIKGDGKLTMQRRLPADAGKLWHTRDKTNHLRLERTGDAYVVKVNDTQVGKVSAAIAPGELEIVKLGFEVKGKTDRSPKVYTLRVAALP